MPFRLTLKFAVELKVTLPLLSVPGPADAAPGLIAPPETVRAPVVPPVPPRMPGLFTVTALPDIEPLTRNVPASTIVAPLYVLTPPKTRMPASILLSVPEPATIPP